MSDSPSIAEFFASLNTERQEIVSRLKRKFDRQVAYLFAQGRSRAGLIYQHAGEKAFGEEKDLSYMLTLSGLTTIPVPIEDFLDGSEFIGALDMELWPQIRKDIIAVNPDIMKGRPKITEYIDSGATGTGKTMKAAVTQAYQLYCLHCFKKPKQFFGQAETTPIVFTMVSSNLTTTRDVLFRPFMDIVTGMPFFRRYTRWNTDKTSVLEFDNGIRVEPVAATNQGIIGRAIISAHIDEANYMAVVQGSQRTVLGDGRRGLYDQAEVFYRAVKLRRKSRFATKLPVPGMIILSSSTRHTDDFLDRRIDEVRSVESYDKRAGATVKGEPGVLVFRHRQYDVQPAHRFSSERFNLLVGTAEYGTRILREGERAGFDYPADARVESVPMDYYYEFKHRPEDALRDVCGISTVNLSPFISQRSKILDAVRRWREGGNSHPVRLANVDLVDHGMPVIVPDKLDADTTTPRFAHIDLSKTGDRCGIAVVRVEDFVELQVDAGVWERLPRFVVEIAVSIQPSQARELDMAEVRNWIVSLNQEYDVPLYAVTYDGFNSAESIQALRKIGIRSGVISMDRDAEAYETLKRALYQDRLAFPDNDILIRELTQLDKNEQTGKIDHPVKGSKDISDAVAGAVYRAATSRLYRSETYYTDGKGNRVKKAQETDSAPRRRRMVVFGSNQGISDGENRQ